MGVIYIKKKKGTSFLEIILALSIIGIISVAIFNNIVFSLKVNKETDGKQNSSILAQQVFEEIKNMGDDSFKQLALSMSEASGKAFLGSEFEEISDGEIIDKLQQDGADLDTLKVFNKKHTELFVMISLPNLKAGLVNEYTTTVDNKPVQEWKSMNKCEVRMEITKKEDLYEVKFYRDGIPPSKYNMTKEELVLKVILDENEIRVYYKKNEFFSKAITGLAEVNMYIKDNTEEDFPYILSNNESARLNIYVEQKTSGNSKFITYGNNIKVYSNEKSENPYGENITTESLCDLAVVVFKKNGNGITKMMELKGHKKFKRFEL